MTKDTFLNTIGKSELISDGQFKAWTFEFMNSAGITTDETRFALNPLKIQQTTIGQIKTMMIIYYFWLDEFPQFANRIRP